MQKPCCAICKVVGIIAGIGALNWGLTGVFNLNLVERVLGSANTAATIAYAVIGISGLIVLASNFIACPACKK